MTKVTCDVAVSVDGFTAGPNQTRDKPFGDGPVDRLTQWMLEQREANAAEIDAILAARAFVMGRNMFAGPGRDAWAPDWKGWWGDDPPYHCDVFVLTHHARAPIPMAGGTTFHFVTGGIQDALARAKASAKGKDIRIGGGAATIRQYLEAGLIDDLHLAVGPVLLGSGEHLMAGLDLLKLGYAVTRHVGTDHATHYILERKQGG